MLITAILLLLITLLFIYSRFIETNLIFTQTTRVQTGFSSKIIVISDIHLGVYKDTNFLKRVVSEINVIKDADAVLIPGDLTYHPSEDLEDLKAMFAPLKDINLPVYAVLGNHDTEHPGPPIQQKLQKALESNKVIFLQNTYETIKNTNITILGLGDNWANQDDISKINEFTKADNLIVMTHNPDTTLRYENSIPDITIAGHAHGGQIRIPYLYKYAIPCAGAFDQGLYEMTIGKVFVSAGLGEVGLPMRLGIPPTIDILEFY